MCIILFSYEMHPRFRWVVAANRDESYLRPTAQASFWQDCPKVLAGRDLEQMGTWMGITKNGRFAALTNFRSASERKSSARSRGELVGNFLCGEETPENYLHEVKAESERYQGFNLLAGDLGGCLYFSSQTKCMETISPGIHGLSNAALNTPWPKVERGRKRLRQWVENASEDLAELFELLADAEQAKDHELPETGVGLEWERTLSPIWIKSPKYGTRSSTVLTISYDNQVTFKERTYDLAKERASELTFSFKIREQLTK